MRPVRSGIVIGEEQPVLVPRCRHFAPGPRDQPCACGRERMFHRRQLKPVRFAADDVRGHQRIGVIERGGGIRGKIRRNISGRAEIRPVAPGGIGVHLPAPGVRGHSSNRWPGNKTEQQPDEHFPMIGKNAFGFSNDWKFQTSFFAPFHTRAPCQVPFGSVCAVLP